MRGVPARHPRLPPEEARALWLRFSDWMEEHKGDLAGFAAQEGFASVRPAVAAGAPETEEEHRVIARAIESCASRLLSRALAAPVLVASRSAQQVAYGNAQELRAPAKRRRR